jgi:imidazolonepropionase
LIPSLSEASSRDQWTLLRGARQLLTLRGPSGPRRGPALNELNIVKDGAILFCNGVIQEVGLARRIENLKHARVATEIDARGGIVMPAFVDPDAVLIYPPGENSAAAQFECRHNSTTEPRRSEERIGIMSTHRLSNGGISIAAECVRAGVLSVGAHTNSAASLRDALRILRIHQSLQARPLRIRSIFCPVPQGDAKRDFQGEFAVESARSLDAIRKRNLAAIVEFVADCGVDPNLVRRAAISASESGCSVRVRIVGNPEEEMLSLALDASSVSLVAAPVETACGLKVMAELGTMGCVHILAIGQFMHERGPVSRAIRREMDEGVPVAVTAGLRYGGATSPKHQFLMHFGVDRCGMTPEEAITASTYNAACSLRMSHVTGSLEPGKAADLLVMDVRDYRDLVHCAGHNDLRLAIRAGQVVNQRDSLTVD